MMLILASRPAAFVQMLSISPPARRNAKSRPSGRLLAGGKSIISTFSRSTWLSDARGATRELERIFCYRNKSTSFFAGPPLIHPEK